MQLTGRRSKAVDEAEDVLPRALRIIAQGGQPIEPPVLQQDGAQHLVTMDAEIVDSGRRDADGALTEAAQLEAGHREPEDLALNGQHHGRGIDLERGRGEIAVEGVMEI